MANKKTKKPAVARARKPSRKTNKTDAHVERALGSLPPDAGQTPPNIPVAAALQEANDVAKAAKRHFAKLRKLPFDHTLVPMLPKVAEALRDAETEWRTLRKRFGDQNLASLRKEAETLKRDLFAAGRYFLRADGAAQALLDAVAEGDGLGDLIDDLHVLADVVHAQAQKLRGADLVGGPEKAAGRAKTLATELANAVSAENTDERAQRAIARRNKLFMLLNDALREIREAARYALRHDDAALAPFRVRYANTRQRPKKRASTSPAPSTTAAAATE